MPLKAKLKYPGLQKQAYILTSNRHCFRNLWFWLLRAHLPKTDHLRSINVMVFSNQKNLDMTIFVILLLDKYIKS